MAYLAIEGPKNRRQLADLFWQDAKDPRDVLSTTIRRLNSDAQVVQMSSRDRVSTNVRCDAAEFEQSASVVTPLELLGLYTGAFLDGVDIDLGEEIEEWLYSTREKLALLHRRAHVKLATDSYEAKDLNAAALHAERALDVEHAPPWQFQGLATITRILQACSSPRSRDAVNEAHELGFAPRREPDRRKSARAPRSPAPRHLVRGSSG